MVNSFVFIYGFCFVARSLRVNLCKLAFGAVVYHLWKQRNNWVIRTRVMGAEKFKNSSVNKDICCRWGLQDSILCK
jgi:hypothetical protein